MNRAGEGISGFSRRVFFLSLVVLSGCGGDDDENCAPYDPDELPYANVIIRAYESNFNPANPGDVHLGDIVEWQNWYREPRTVISGTGPDDPEAGELFNVTLQPYCSGEAIGGRFQIRMTNQLPDTIHYFNTIVPDGFNLPFRGTIVVQP